jgi:hypothetical protein
MCAVVQNFLMPDQHANSCAERLARTGIADIARMRAAGDEEANRYCCRSVERVSQCSNQD